MTRTYLAGPMTGRPDYNAAAFDAAARYARSQGWEPVNPHDTNPAHPGECPPGTRHRGHPNTCWYTAGIAALAGCDALLLLPGWETSAGARLERAEAERQGLALHEYTEVGPVRPYYSDGQVTLYHGDCREITDWLKADFVLTDPPYGTDRGDGYARGITRGLKLSPGATIKHRISGDSDTRVRDEALALLPPETLAIVFGSAIPPAPARSVQTLYYLKPPDAGAVGSRGGWRRDVELMFLVGPWPVGAPVRTSLYATRAPSVGNPSGVAARAGHPHAKPLDVLEALVADCPAGVIADPFAGSGSTLVAARNLGRKAIGVELEERYCEVIARRLSQDVLPLFGGAA